MARARRWTAQPAHIKTPAMTPIFIIAGFVVIMFALNILDFGRLD